MPNILPSLQSLPGLSADQLRAGQAAVDLELAELDETDSGELRNLSPAEEERFDELMNLRNRIDRHLLIRQQYDRHPDSVQPANGSSDHGVRRDNRDVPPLLRSDQSVSDWVKRSRPRTDQPEMSFAKIARGLATGRWDDAELEQRAIAESPATAGGHMVPTPVAAQVIDKARNASRVVAAGAQTIPMTSATLKYPRLTTDAPASWRSEAGAITDQALVFDSVTFTAQSLAVLVKCSWELFEDTAPESMATVENSFAQVLGLELDRAALRGSGSAPEPRGIRNQTGVTLTSHGTNGSTIGSPPSATVVGWEFLVDALATIRGANFEPNAQIMAPRTDQKLSLIRDTTNQYIAPPSYLDGIPRLQTQQIPTNLTVGTSTDCTEVYSGQWDMCWIGVRTGFNIKFLQERYADNGQYAFLASLRADVQLAQPAAFVVDLGVRS